MPMKPEDVAAVARFVAVVAALSDVCRDQRYWSIEAADVLAAAGEFDRLTKENAALREKNRNQIAMVELARSERDEAEHQAHAFIIDLKTLQAERDALKIEYESRAIFMDKLFAIIGYDNSDGFHSEPDPIAIAIALRADAARLDVLADRGMSLVVFDGQSCRISLLPPRGVKYGLGRSNVRMIADGLLADTAIDAARRGPEGEG